MGKEPYQRRPEAEGSRHRARPTPVRELMEAPVGAAEDEAEEVTLEIDGELWKARAIGSGRTGTAPDGAATLLLLAFTGEDGSGVETREVLVVASSLSDLGSDDLFDAFSRSRTRRQEPDDLG